LTQIQLGKRPTTSATTQTQDQMIEWADGGEKPRHVG
jgi:hypothetical protein